MTFGSRAVERMRLRIGALEDNRVAGLFVFLAFFPYPALKLGDSTGLQASHIMAAILIVMLGASGLLAWRTGVAYLAIVLPWVLALAVAALADRLVDATIAVNVCLSVVMSLAVLIPAGSYCHPRYLPGIVTGASAAMVVHGTLGLLQVYFFSRGTFPLLGVYSNPSFARLSDVSDYYVQEVKRPFGLFPEPSAMAACLGPWAVLLLGILLQPESRRMLDRRIQILGWIGAAIAVTLILIARTGFAAPMVLGLGAVAVHLAFAGRRLSPSLRRRLWVLLAVGVVVIMAFGVQQLRLRLPIEDGSSWDLRYQSIVVGLLLPLQEPLTFVFGVGPGQSTQLLLSGDAFERVSGIFVADNADQVGAVWSLVALLFAETGLIGVVAATGAALFAARSLWASGPRVPAMTAGILWLFAVGATTSYLPLSPLWLGLGIFLCMDRLMPAREPSRVGSMPSSEPLSSHTTRRPLIGEPG